MTVMERRAGHGSDRTSARGLRRFLRPYRGALSIAAALALTDAVLDLARPWPLKLAVDHAIGHQPLGGPLAPLGRLGSGGLAAVAAAAMLVLVGIGSLVGYLTTWLGSASTERVGAGLREAVFARMLDLALPFHDRHRAGDLVTRLTGDVTRVEDALVAWFTTLLPEAVTLAGMIVVMLAVDVPLALTAMLAAPPLALMVAMRRARIRSTQRAARDANASLAANATDLLRNVRVVQAFGREPEARRRFGENSAASVRTALTAMDLEARFAPVADLVLAAGSGAVLWIGVGAVTSGRITLGTLLVVLSYLSGLYGPIRSLARLARPLARGAASRERIMEVLAAGETVADAPDAIEAAPPRQGLALRGVWFAYPGGTAVLRNHDLDLAAGEWVCVVGPTGVGKSTLLNLLLRFYDPTGGTVELDGVPLDRLSLASLRRQLALVPQDPWMLDGTIAENIAFGRPEADEAAVRSAGGLALVDEFADGLPDGWDTVVGEGGVRLSGGQRRRVALARALVRDAAVLLLDEPTSGLDAASEDAVLRALELAVRGLCVLDTGTVAPRGRARGGPGGPPRALRSITRWSIVSRRCRWWCCCCSSCCQHRCARRHGNRRELDDPTCAYVGGTLVHPLSVVASAATGGPDDCWSAHRPA